MGDNLKGRLIDDKRLVKIMSKVSGLFEEEGLNLLETKYVLSQLLGYVEYTEKASDKLSLKKAVKLHYAGKMVT